MMRNAAILPLLAALAAAAGCSRTYDGTVVPTYRMTLDHFAGIPVLTMQRTPLEEPRAAMEMQAALTAFPPPPAPPPDRSALPPAPTIEPARPRPRRTTPRRVAPSSASVAETPLVCRSGASAERAVTVVCEQAKIRPQ